MALYRKLGRVTKDPLLRRHFSAQALAIEGKREEAETELRRVLAIAPDKSGSRALLAQLLSDQGKFDEAARHLALVVDEVPDAFRRLTTIKRITEDDRPLIERMRALADAPALEVGSRISIAFGLGKAFDDLGDYEQAMLSFETGNRLKAKTLRLDRPALAAGYDHLINRCTAEELRNACKATNPSADGDLPIFIVGMPRSGSTLVEQILSSHPHVAAGGELTFWLDRTRADGASGPGDLDPHASARDAQDYSAALRKIGPRALRVTDKALDNYARIWRILLAFPSARIIHCRRHPVDTCLAIFFQLFGQPYDFAYDRGDLVFAYRQYERLMEHWRRTLPAGHILEVDYERLIVDREVETRRLIDFCGVGWHEACLRPEENDRLVRTSSLWQVRQPVYVTAVERWRRYEPWLGELRELMPGNGEPV